ncbi:MAG: chemotaxis protein CheW [Smithella sp.]
MAIPTTAHCRDFVNGDDNVPYKKSKKPSPDRTCIIVVEVKTTTGNVLMGIVLDAVSEVLNIRNAEIEDTPACGTSLKTDFILGMAKAGNRVKILLDIDKVISAQEIEIVLQAA